MPVDQEFSLDVTVREMMARHPGTRAVFSRLGMDTCCGAGVPIRAAAVRDGVELDELSRALQLEIAAGG
jgi:iron-sulfur cluster repair protein YtfE (RIC family)